MMTRTVRNTLILVIGLLIIFSLAAYSIIDIAQVASNKFTPQKKVMILTHIQKALERFDSMRAIEPIRRSGLHIYNIAVPPPDSHQINQPINKEVVQWVISHPNISKYSIRYLQPFNKHRPHWLVVEFEPNILSRISMHQDFWILITLLILFIGVCIWIGYDFNKPLKHLRQISNSINAGSNLPTIIATGSEEIAPITDAINKQSQRINQLMNDRTQMLAAISHDLRTPITRLRLRAEDLEDETLRKKILADCNEMEAMINGVLDFIRTESDEPAVDFDFISLLDTLTNERQDANQDCKLDTPLKHVTVHGQMQSLRRSLANLIDNGLKYGQTVRINVKLHDKKLHIDIADRGPGIPEGEMGRVFLPFYRLEQSRNKATGGTGLGLVIAKNIIQHHHGSLELRNSPKGGLIASVVLSPKLSPDS